MYMGIFYAPSFYSLFHNPKVNENNEIAKSQAIFQAWIR